MWICISGQQMDNLDMLSYCIFTSWGRWCSGQMWRRFWTWLSVSVIWRCACSLVFPSCLQRLCNAMLGKKASGHLICTKHSQVSFNCSLHLFMPTTLNTLLCLFSDLGARFLHQELCFLIDAREKPSLAIVAILKARRMLDCSSCTRPPCLAIVADMLQTYKKVVGACNNEIWQLPQPVTLS